MFRKIVALFFCTGLVAIMGYSAFQALRPAPPPPPDHRPAWRIAADNVNKSPRALGEWEFEHTYRFRVQLPERVPGGARATARVVQLGPDLDKELKGGATEVELRNKQEAELELTLRPEDARPERFFAIEAAWWLAKPDANADRYGCKPPEEVRFFMTPAFKPEYGPAERTITVGAWTVRKYLGEKRFRVVNAKGEPYREVAIKAVMTDATPRLDGSAAPAAPFTRTFDLRTDANGVCPVPIIEGMNYRLTMAFQDCFRHGPCVVGGRELSGPAGYVDFWHYPVLVASFPAGAFAGPAAAEVATVAPDPGSVMLIHCLENVDGVERPSRRMGVLFYQKATGGPDDDDGHGPMAMYTEIIGGQSILPMTSKVAALGDGSPVEPRFGWNVSAPDFDRNYYFEPRTLALSGDGPVSEVTFRLMPKYPIALTLADSEGRPAPDARLYVLNPSETAPLCFRSGSTVNLAPGTHKAVLHAPGCEVTEMDLTIPEKDRPTTMTLRTRPAPEVTIDFRAPEVTEDGTATVRAIYDRLPFLTATTAVVRYQQGRGRAALRLDARRAFSVAVTDSAPMRFPTALTRHPGGAAVTTLACEAPRAYRYRGSYDPLRDTQAPGAGRPVVLVWMLDVPGIDRLPLDWEDATRHERLPLGALSPSAAGEFSAILAPGQTYRRYLVWLKPEGANAGTVAEWRERPHAIDQGYRLPDYTAPAADAQKAPEALHPRNQWARDRLDGGEMQRCLSGAW